RETAARGLPHELYRRVPQSVVVHAGGSATSGEMNMQDDSQRRDGGRNEQSGSGGGQSRPDEQIRGDVFDALSLRGVDLGDVSIQVKDARVTLDGSVSDVHMKQRIEDIASACAGVQRIDN